MSAATALPPLLDSCALSSHENLLPFQDATTPNSTVALGVLILTIHFARKHFFHPILKQVGARMATSTNGPKWVEQNEDSIDNFSEFSFRFLFRVLVCGLGLLEFRNSPEWWYDTPLMWEGYPHHVVSNTMQILYLLQIAYHLQDLGTVLLEGNSKRKDFKEMLVHHIVTALLLFGSTRLHMTRVGTIISTLHAVTDVPKDFAKIAKTLEWGLTAKLAFGSFVLTWIVARLYLYPFVYVRSVFVDTQPCLDAGISPNTMRVLEILLIVLIVLNVMWFHMILKVMYKLARGKKVDDPQLVKKQEETEASSENPAWLSSSSSTDETAAGNVSDDSTAFSDCTDSISDDETTGND